METKSVFDSEFVPYGKVHHGYDLTGLIAVMGEIPLPEEGTGYCPALPQLEAEPVFRQLETDAFGGMPIQLGMCWGRNTRLNCLEYHRDSEFNVGTDPFILLLAHQWEIEDGILDTAKVRAFHVPSDTLVEIYATTVHYAPCHVNEADGFRVAVILPRGTNTERPEGASSTGEGCFLRARNKWLLAHPESSEAKAGAAIGLTGPNLDSGKEVSS